MSLNGSQSMHAVSAISVKSRSCLAPPPQNPDGLQFKTQKGMRRDMTSRVSRSLMMSNAQEKVEGDGGGGFVSSDGMTGVDGGGSVKGEVDARRLQQEGVDVVVPGGVGEDGGAGEIAGQAAGGGQAAAAENAAGGGAAAETAAQAAAAAGGATAEAAGGGSVVAKTAGQAAAGGVGGVAGTASEVGGGRDDCEVLSITPWDAPLVSPGEANPFPEGQKKPDLKKGMHFNLENNVWGTNYIMWVPWSDKDVNMAFRFRLEVDRVV